jgi:hypothetical protein
MLRSATTLNRTEVQPIREMKQPTIRQLLPTPPASGRSHTDLPTPKIQRKLAINLRLFKV